MTASLAAEDVHRVVPPAAHQLFGPRAERHALAGVSLAVGAGDTLGIVGESGSGKSTLARILLGLDRATRGTVTFGGRPVAPGRPHELRWFRRDVQIVFQDPLSSLDPRMRVADIVAEPLVGLDVAGAHEHRIAEVLGSVGIDPDTRHRYPHEFSGGQQQRIAIARALAPHPKVLVADEPVSSLDVSVRAQILDLLPRPRRAVPPQPRARVARSRRDPQPVRARARAPRRPRRRGGRRPRRCSPSPPIRTPGGCSPPSRGCDCVPRPRRPLLAAPALRSATQAGLAPRRSHRWTAR